MCKIRANTNLCVDFSRTIPPLPTSSLPASNCGLIRATKEPVSFNKVVAIGSTLSKEIKATSIEIKSLSSPNCTGVTVRIFCFSILMTLGSCRNFQAN